MIDRDESDEPTIFQVEMSEAGGLVYLKALTAEQVEKIPYGGDLPASTSLEAQERILWVLNECVINIDDVKERLKNLSPNQKESEQALLVLYQCCVSINPAVDMTVWNYMIRQKGLYHDMFEVEAIPLAEPKDIIRNSVQKMLFDDWTSLDLDFSFDPSEFLPEVMPPPPWDAQPQRQNDNNKSQKEEFVFDPKKVLSLEQHLQKNLVGQSEAIDEIVKTLKRATAGLKDDRRPLGVFLFCGSSGTGKTEAAKLIQSHLFGEDSRMVRVDCSEYQQKHDSIKLLGSPNSYVGYEDGGQLTNAVKAAKNTVLLLDEAEKAHRDFWDIFLKVFDEGYLTDNKGENVSFENTIIVMTSNLGNEKIAKEAFTGGTGFHQVIEDQFDSGKPPARSYVEKETRSAINEFFKPEFVNRLDDIVIFNYLTEDNLRDIAHLELEKVQKKVKRQKYRLSWTKVAEKTLANKSLKAIQGARAMSRIRRREIEDPLAELILTQAPPANTIFKLSTQKSGDDVKFVWKTAIPAEPTPKVVSQNERN